MAILEQRRRFLVASFYLFLKVGTRERRKDCRGIFQAFEENSLEQRVLYELSGDACGRCGYLFRGSCGYNTAAVRSAARTHIYNIVGIADNI